MNDKATLYTETGFITVQSCDEEEANIGVFVTSGPNQRSAYYHVNLPELTRQWKPLHATALDLPAVHFDNILDAHRDRLLEMIAQLNGIACGCCEYVPIWLIPGSPCANCGLPPYPHTAKQKP